VHLKAKEICIFIGRASATHLIANVKIVFVLFVWNKINSVSFVSISTGQTFMLVSEK